jgi:hypothetical protein
MSVEDSRVFRDQSVLGYPQVLTQKCFNRFGRFLVIEECDMGGRDASWLWLQKGKIREAGINLSLNFRLR